MNRIEVYVDKRIISGGYKQVRLLKHVYPANITFLLIRNNIIGEKNENNLDSHEE